MKNHFAAPPRPDLSGIAALVFCAAFTVAVVAAFFAIAIATA